MLSTTFQLHGGRLQGRAVPPERRRALQRQHGRERQVLAASETTALSLAGRVEFDDQISSNRFQPLFQ